MKVQFASTVAARKAGVKGWEPFAWERIGSDAVAVTGGIPRIITRGKNKGEKRWDGPGTKEVVTDAEAQAEFNRYEKDTGNCGDCSGTGQVFAGWSTESGVQRKDCKRCNAAGHPPKINPTPERKANGRS